MRNFLTVALMLMLLVGCQKVTAPMKKFVVKFEVTLTSPVKTSSAIITRTGLANPVMYSDFTTGQSWSKTTEFETRNRPIDIFLNAQNIRLTSQGSATCKIFVNGEEKATSTAQTTTVGSEIEVSTIPVTYSIR